LAVAPVGSVLPAAAVGADFEAVEGFAAGAAVADAAVAGAAAAAGAAVVASAAGVPFDAFCTPPWPLQVPLPVDVEVVPSLQVLGPPDAAGAAGAAAGVAAAGAAVGAAEVPAFWTPPWPLQVPLPVDVEVVPSLQVVGVESAQTGSDSANTIKGAAMSPTRSDFCMNIHSLV
jgi:hypothetical protein